MISKSLKSDGRMGLDMEVISIPRLLEAALILESAGLPFINQKKTTQESFTLHKMLFFIILYNQSNRILERFVYLMVINGASRVNLELRIKSSLVNNISKHALSSWTPTNVA
jgi:hypothetical protein